MLPLPPIQISRATLTSALRAADRWTLWAFNPPAGRR